MSLGVIFLKMKRYVIIKMSQFKYLAQIQDDEGNMNQK